MIGAEPGQGPGNPRARHRCGHATGVVKILDRRSFNELVYYRTGQLAYIADPEPPEPFEAGWKDTVRAHSLMVTRFIVRFEGYTGRYVWHCHLLEHEDNEMMRPYDVLPRPVPD